MAIQVNRLPPIGALQQRSMAPQITARGRQLQSSAPPIPKSGIGAGMAGLGKSLGEIADTIKESRQKANRKALIDSLVSDTDVDQGDAFDASPMTMLGEDEMFGDDEENIPTTAPTPVARPSKKINKMEAEGIPPRAQNAIRRYQQSGNYDEAFKIYNTFATKEPTTYKLGMGEVIKDASGKLIASGVPKDTRSNLLKGYQDAVRYGYKGSIEDFAKINRSGTTVNIGGDTDFGPVPEGSRRVKRIVPKTPENPEGIVYEIVPLKGSKEYMKQKELKEKKKGAQEEAERALFTVNRDIEGALSFMNQTKDDLIQPTRAGAVLKELPLIRGYTDAGRLENYLESIGSRISISALNTMRKNSPTGGALGSVTERELKMLRDSYGTLDQYGDPQLLEERLIDLQRIFHEVVHGPVEGRKMFEKKMRERRERFSQNETIPKDKADDLVNKYLYIDVYPNPNTDPYGN